MFLKKEAFVQERTDGRAKMVQFYCIYNAKECNGNDLTSVAHRQTRSNKLEAAAINNKAIFDIQVKPCRPKHQPKGSTSTQCR